MIITAKKAFRFTRPDRTFEAGSPFRPERDLYFTVVPSPAPQSAPDWIRDSPIFALAVGDGDLAEVG